MGMFFLYWNLQGNAERLLSREDNGQTEHEQSIKYFNPNFGKKPK